MPRFENETAYRTREIKSLLVATHNHLATAEGRLDSWSWVTFEIGYTRRHPYSGHARLDGSRSRLRFRRPDGRKRPDWAGGGRRSNDFARARDVVRLGWHEMLHLYGYRHEQMARSYPATDEVEAICRDAGMEPSDPLPLYAWARDDGEEDEPSEAEEFAEKFRHALNKRKEWTAKARRAKSYLQKWRRRENRARRKLEELDVDVDAIRQDVLGGYEPAMAGDLDV